MNKSSKKKVQPEQKLNSEPKADDKQVSPAIGNARVIGGQVEFPEITIVNIKEFMEKSFLKKNSDTRASPDVEIYETKTIFCATLDTGNGKIMVGLNGFRRFFLSGVFLSLPKIKYNGKILSLRETKSFCEQFKSTDLKEIFEIARKISTTSRPINH